MTFSELSEIPVRVLGILHTDTLDYSASKITFALKKQKNEPSHLLMTSTQHQPEKSHNSQSIKQELFQLRIALHAIY